MNENLKQNDLFNASHMVILICYTIFSTILIGESLLLGWERWAVVLIIVGVVTGWIVHIRQNLSESTRLWVYSMMMMATFFFYGMHRTSTFDLCAVMGSVIMIYTMTGVEALVWVCQITYYFTFAYDIVGMILAGEPFDSLVITRSMLHVALITMVGWVARVIIDRWRMVLNKVGNESDVLKAQIQRLNDFLANISHEIRTPINVISGLIGICIKNEQDDEMRADLESIGEAGQRVGNLIGDILDYSEIDMDKLVVNEENYMLSSLLNDIVMEIAPHRAENIELVIDVDPAIPSVMKTDVVKLKKIIHHLIDNSMKYTPEGGIYVHLTSEEREYGINLCVEVTDTGIGMVASEVDNVFEGFYQADSGRSRYASGLGLGLSIVSGFIRSLNGFLTLESKPGEGTCVRVSLPQKVVDEQRCMSLRNADELSLGAYLHFEKYSDPNVRVFYNAMVRDLVIGLGARMQRADNLEGFKRIAKITHFSHVFVGKEEYEEDPDFMEELAKETLVAVIADYSFEPRKDTNVRIMRKPFYCFPVISFLNTKLGDLEDEGGRLYARGVRALVVDDEPMNHMVAREIFTEYGMVVDKAMSGMEALSYMENNDPDIIFMDHMMPGMDGVETMKRIRAKLGKERKDIPIVALTANATSTAREMFMREGFDGFIAKPIELVELEHVLKKVLPKSMLSVEKPETLQVERKAAKAGKPEKAVETAEAEKETETAADPLVQALEALGVDVDAGLRYCQNDRGFYEELILQYAGDAAEKRANAEKYLQEHNLKQYEVLIHSVKSSSKMIGAMTLSEHARLLEKAAEEGDEAAVRNGHNEAMSEFEALSVTILRQLGAEAPAPSAGPASSGDVMEFGANDGVMEFGPAQETEASGDGIMEFVPAEEQTDPVGDGIMEFEPEEVLS
ncbi:MAG: response regulator [Butyrivibrio sp.]|nr:response regulator [Butyrivibrio sp.]